MTRAERRRAARQQEAAEVRYQLTAEEIRQIEKKAVESKKEQIRDSIMKEIQEEWQRREEMLSGKDDGEIVQNVLCLLLAVPVKVLCEKFKWKPYPLDQGRKQKLQDLKVLGGSHPGNERSFCRQKHRYPDIWRRGISKIWHSVQDRGGRRWKGLSAARTVSTA